MPSNIDSALSIVFYGILFVGSLLGVTTAGIGLLGPRISGYNRQFAFRNGTIATILILAIGLSQRIATAQDSFLTATGYILLGVLAAVVITNAMGWLVCTLAASRSNARREQTA